MEAVEQQCGLAKHHIEEQEENRVHEIRDIFAELGLEDGNGDGGLVMAKHARNKRVSPKPTGQTPGTHELTCSDILRSDLEWESLEPEEPRSIADPDKLVKARRVRFDHFDTSPLADDPHSFRLKDALCGDDVAVPHYLSEDEEGRFVEREDFHEREYYYRKHTGRATYKVDQALELRDLFYITNALRLAAIVLDEHVRQNKRGALKPTFRGPIECWLKNWDAPRWPKIKPVNDTNKEGKDEIRDLTVTTTPPGSATSQLSFENEMLDEEKYPGLWQAVRRVYQEQVIHRPDEATLLVVGGDYDKIVKSSNQPGRRITHADPPLAASNTSYFPDGAPASDDADDGDRDAGYAFHSEAEIQSYQAETEAIL
ncbi:hypothetical protein QFC22_000857 [Naganishia vaughanmartiniae]|uniref:Uncharacterized protein n=1 Tax=Naganishia vaughanmartiniae TaxID=1424756 RepID=A0ACC2XL19_9TREE|nr:hypothetical protein QFC22_000857 [Naganishia vaughanmartiniae]